ncbi:unnamed protein product [Calypogeia fissa]
MRAKLRKHDKLPWLVLWQRDSQATALTIFITWAGLRQLQDVREMLVRLSACFFLRVRKYAIGFTAALGLRNGV